jgi:hypothetical protein
MRSKPLASPCSMTTRGMCIMHMNCHFDAVLVLHTRTASLVGAMEVQAQCRGAPTEIWYWSTGVAGFAGGATEKGRCKVW